MQTTDLFCCPKCHGALKQDAQALVCANCGSAARFHRGGIVDFATRDLYWSYLDRPELARMVDVAETKGIDAALEQFLRPRPDGEFYFDLLHENRGDFRFLIPAPSDGICLDLGSGWGANALGLCRQFGHVVAADGTRENLEFVQVRMRDAGRKNITLAHIDPLEATGLPFRDGTFAAVVLSGVLEWVGTGVDTGSPRDHQLRVLRELRRVMAPDGYLYIGIENRYFVLYFVGKREPHAMVPFLSILPRPLANVVSYLARRRPFRNYTYSQRGLTTLLAEAGFNDPEFFLPLPSYQHPDVIAPLENTLPLRYWPGELMGRRNRKRALYGAGLGILGALGLLKYLASDFSVVARRTA